MGRMPGDLIRKPLEALFPEDYALQMKGGLQRVMGLGKAGDGRDSTSFPPQRYPDACHSHPLPGWGLAKLSSVMGISRDITDLKAEEALKESEQTKQILIDGIPEVSAVAGQERNHPWCELGPGADAAEKQRRAAGADAYDFLDPETARRRKSMIDEVFCMGPPRLLRGHTRGDVL